jgi:CBS domain-containing protein
MRPTLTCGAEDSIRRAVEELRHNGGGLIPVTRDGKLIGVVTEGSLAIALANDVNIHDACTEAMADAFPIAPYATGAEALRMLTDFRMPALIVADDAGHVMGILTVSDLYPRRRMLPRPDPVGGMATPFGVYLTSGGISGGVSQLAIAATGAAMFTMLTTSAVASAWMLSPLDKTRLSEGIKTSIAEAVAFALFGLIMRLSPLAGTHGAEHMVVHAMERGEELTPEIVARMPRVHPRCGTNIAVALTLFLGISMSEWTSDFSARVVLGAFVTLFFWRPLGSFVQQNITTKKPNEKQLRSGIKAATELIDRHSTAKMSTSNIPRRIWNSGLIHVMTGSMVTYWVLQGVMTLFHFKLPGME